MKAILIIDIPSELDVNNLLIDYCVHTKGEYKSIRKGGNHPLKLLPKKKMPKQGEAFPQDMRLIDRWRGWDACIDEITGETE